MQDRLVIKRNGKESCLKDLWKPHPGFLVGGGPSINNYNLNRLKERGIVSFGVNQVGAWAPVKAWCFSDTQSKFHSSLYLDPAIMTFSPSPKLKRTISHKTEEGFKSMSIKVRDCPNTFEFNRKTCFIPETFYEDEYAHWGPSKDQPKNIKIQGCLCTMLIGMRILNWLGVKKVYLLGVDFKGRDGLCYGFPSDKKERNKRYKWEYNMMKHLIPEMDKRGIEYFNCNKYSNCDLFPYVSFDEAIEDCKGSVESDPLDTKDWYNRRIMTRDCKRNSIFKPIHYG